MNSFSIIETMRLIDLVNQKIRCMAKGPQTETRKNRLAVYRGIISKLNKVLVKDNNA